MQKGIAMNEQSDTLIVIRLLEQILLELRSEVELYLREILLRHRKYIG